VGAVAGGVPYAAQKVPRESISGKMLRGHSPAGSSSVEGEAVTPINPNASQRQVMQRLRTDHWRPLAKLDISIGHGLLNRLVMNGWVERRDGGGFIELKMTAAGAEALRAPIPTTIALRKAPERHPEGDTIVVTKLELPEALCAEVDRWANRHSLTRTVALRRLLELGLKAKRP
jgi:hypothetical protein